jgi:hypothetical protein
LVLSTVEENKDNGKVKRGEGKRRKKGKEGETRKAERGRKMKGVGGGGTGGLVLAATVMS